MLTAGHRGHSIAFVALALAAPALSLLLVAACEPTTQTAPAAPAASPTSGAPTPAGPRAAQAAAASTCTQTPPPGAPNWTQLCQFLSGYDCALSTGGLNCAPNDAFILAGTAGPAKPLYAVTTGPAKWTLQTSQLIASVTKMPAAAAILEALYNSKKYSVTTPIGQIVAGYLSANQASKSTTAFQDATKFQAAWKAMPQTITLQLLLSMTSGLTTLNGKDPTPPCLDDSASSVKTNGDPYTTGTLGACATQIASTKYVVIPPGSAFGYSSAGYQIAGYVATLLPSSTGAYPYAGDWISFFDDTFLKPMGLVCPTTSTSTSCYSYANDLVANKTGPTPPGTTTVTNPRISGGASSDATSYSTILTMILNLGAYNGKPVLDQSVVNELETSQLPSSWLTDQNLPDEGLQAKFVYYAPYPATPQALRGYSFGLFIPTSLGMPPTGGFFNSLSAPNTWENGSLVPQDLTTPPSGTVLMDPGEGGAVSWFNIGTGARFSAVNIIFKSLTDITTVGLDMMRTADSAITCQLEAPGVQPTPPTPVPTPDGGTYCVVPAAACTVGAVQACACPNPPGCCIAQETCEAGGVWGPCKVVGTLNGPCTPVPPGNPP